MDSSESTPVSPSEQSRSGDAVDYPSDGGSAGPILISNEFADVVVRKVLTRNGPRLDVWSPLRGTRIQLDAVALDCLSFQEPELITAMLSRRPAP